MDAVKVQCTETVIKSLEKEQKSITTDSPDAQKRTYQLDQQLQKHNIIHVSLEDAISSKQREKYLNGIKKKYHTLSQYVPGMNSLHKYSVDVSLLHIPLKELKQHCADIIMQQFELDIHKMKLYGGFVINYGDKYAANRKLTKHRDDSTITINYCLDSKCSGNEVIFYKSNRHRIAAVPQTGWALIHRGDYVHETMAIESGTRWNIVLWFK